jgi:hypothetical protein
MDAQLDWQVCQSDEEWETVSQAARPQPLALPASPIRRLLAPGICLLFVLAAGGLRWHSVQSERAAVAAAIDRTVKTEVVQDHSPQIASLPTIVPWPSVQPQVQLEAQALTGLAQAPPGGGAVTRLHYLAGDISVVEVVLPATPAQPALRQTRVYQRIGPDWVRITPSANYWGAPSQWETDHLLIRYYAHDEQAVAEVAVQLDARYAELHRLFLGEPPTQPLMVVVDPAQFPGGIAGRTGVSEPLVVASPAVYLAPETISDAELLAQSLLLALLDDLTDQALLPYDGEGDYAERVRRRRVGQLLDGVRLWQVWQGDLPLASWREPLVQWVSSDARPWLPEPGEAIPAFYAEFCAMHRLWMATPFELQIPLACDDAMDSGERYLWWRSLYAPPLRLAEVPLLTVGMALDAFDPPTYEQSHPAKAVALATVLEYAAASYGPARIPVLIDEAGRQEGWATLIPAVFGVSADEFEAGWQAYLTEHYGVSEGHERG